VAFIDIFNGDADGICALTQLRLAEPRNSRLVTGVKRDIALVASAEIAPGDHVTILDISLDKNRAALTTALDNGALCLYVDHHFAGEIPQHSNLVALINTAADVCTSILVNQHLHGAHVEWAVVGAFGDNLGNSARVLAKPLGLDSAQLDSLERLGIYINYNGYGAALEDLHFAPADLYRLVSQHASPFDFMRNDTASFDKLERGYLDDMAQAQALQPELADAQVGLYILPDAPWARRVSGVFSNELANQHPDRAHAVLTLLPAGDYLVSVRAPLNNKTGADEVCRQFATGGGRKAAAGINQLSPGELPRLVDTMREFYR
jgi:hypothetical protein